MEERATSKRSAAECRTSVRCVRARKESKLPARSALQREECKAASVDESLLYPLLASLQRDQCAWFSEKSGGTQRFEQGASDARDRWQERRSISGAHG
jgi:hypothetical protein